MSIPAPSARSRFAALVERPERELDLASAALLIAAEEYPQLPIDSYLRRLDLLAERVRDRLAEETGPVVVLQELGKVLFVDEGFRGNVEAYYDPRNSYLNDVLDRRLGIPLTLSIVFLEVGWRLGLPLEGVNFPGHFLVRYAGEAVRLVVDPFHHGQTRFEDDAQELLDRTYGGAVRLLPEHLASAGRKDILIRLLNNLKAIYLNTSDERRALGAIERILILAPDAVEERRDRGMLLARTGNAPEAITDLRCYVDARPEAPDSDQIRLLVETLRQDPNRQGRQSG